MHPPKAHPEVTITGSLPMNSGIKPNLSRSCGRTSDRSLDSSTLFGLHIGIKADHTLAHASLDDLIQSIERTAADEQHIGGIKRNEFLMRMLTSALRRYVRDRTLQNLQQRLLHALAADIARDGRILRLAGRSYRSHRYR